MEKSLVNEKLDFSKLVDENGFFSKLVNEKLIFVLKTIH